LSVHRVWAVYFSPTGTTSHCVKTIAKRLSVQGRLSLKELDFTCPCAREEAPVFSAQDLVIFGTPVYAGRVPNLLLSYIASALGNGALAVPIVVYGNRAYDDALIELRNTLESGGFQTIAGAAFVGEHSFGNILATGRPDASDIRLALSFADGIAAKLKRLDPTAAHVPIAVRGNEPIRPYYRPTDAEGNFIDIRKVKPVTNENCVSCFSCADHCPMGAISKEDAHAIPGICIKCNSCVKGCPLDAKSFTDPRYLFHRDDITARYREPRHEPELFL